jgi:two-component system KDP operon response regulator KdpE
MRRFLRAALSAQDYRLVEAATAREGMAHAAGRNPDVILLDLRLPDRDGLEVTRELREWSATPIIVLSARGREQDKVAALDLGADDYLTKPFGVDELLARIRVALRHAARPPGAAPEPVFEAGDLRVDFARREVRRAGVQVHLTPTEYKLLGVLIRHAGKVLTHRQLLREVWGSHSPDQSHYVRVYMAQLRQKLEADPARPRLLLTEPGVGYRLRAE